MYKYIYDYNCRNILNDFEMKLKKIRGDSMGEIGN